MRAPTWLAGEYGVTSAWLTQYRDFIAGFKGSPGLVDKIALGRLGTPADIAPMAVAILSEKYGAYMTGATVVVDGGIALYNWIDPTA